MKKLIRVVKLKSELLAKILINVGIDPRRLISIKNIFRYWSDFRDFRKLGGLIHHRFPILIDYEAKAGAASGHYFHQDLLVASFIHKTNPARHIDIGSRIDGFVAHIASFRKIEVIDVRDLPNTGHSNIEFLKADLMISKPENISITDSISCLHAIEHFGLGRYGDPINPNGHLIGFNNILKMLKKGGVLYISFPIAETSEVYFNAHRVFDPKEIFSWIDDDINVELLRFDYVDDVGNLHENVDLMSYLCKLKFGCGIYTLRKM